MATESLQLPVMFLIITLVCDISIPFTTVHNATGELQTRRMLVSQGDDRPHGISAS